MRVPAVHGPGVIDALVELGTRLACRPVLILTDDLTVDSVSAHRREIEPLFRISLPPHEVVRSLADKTQFAELAQREGLPVPRTVCVTQPGDFARLAALTPPVIVKPAGRAFAASATLERAARAATIAEAESACARMLPTANRVVVQEWVDGPDTDITFTLFTCGNQGQVLGLFTGRKLVCSPPAMGTTAVCVAAPETAEALRGPTLRFIERMGYRGLGSLEFKRDRRTNQLLIIEPTVGRTDWQEEVATLCGVNLPLLTYLDALGQRIPALDTPSSALAWRSSVGFRAALPRGTRVVDGYFRWSDPVPALYFYGYERGLQRVWRRALRFGRG